ncbi:MAG: glycosyltransferase family 2 protein [Candidatus Hydrogenedentota bacterium]|nr:MAG: glycosyltransferase family 2 protein [Candidatus Hydrogenedentota bacterium]
MASKPLISIIIPIYNEQELLPTVLREVRSLPIDKELILVDDCSTDGTREILSNEERKPDTRVLYHERNRGKGAAIVTGLKAARGEVVIIQDADMEYDPRDILSVVQPILEGKTRVCYGSRFRGRIEGMRLPNRIANHILAWLVTLLYGQRITDEATAYKAFRRDVIQSLDLKCQRFEFCPEVTAKVLRRGERIVEVPVVYRARTFEEGKKIGYRDFFVAVATLLKYRFFR